ncbi:MAG TPA: MBL fold metallo-hydrolase [Acidimicrobiales bacterium]
METRLDEIADGIHRISRHLPEGAVQAPGGLTVSQFLVLAEEPLLFHAGLRSGFPDLVTKLRRLLPLARLRWLSFGHVEADECGALNLMLAAAPFAEVAVVEAGPPGSVQDLADRTPRLLAPGEVLDLGGRRVVPVPTPHAPHNREAQVLFEETTGTLLCGDLFTQLARGPAVTTGDVVGAALDAETACPTAAPGPAVPAALRALAPLRPRTLATMHGSAYEGDGAAALTALADGWEARFSAGDDDRGGPDPDGRVVSGHG